MSEQPSDPLVDTLVDGRYHVHSKVARGGMATVYLATDLRLDRNVALKVLHPHLATDNSFLDRLRREAKAAARLSHPHVVGVLDQGNDGTLAYLVMEYIRGHTLRDVLDRQGFLTPRLALAYLDAVVEGLGAAHAAGLVHRDVKPENVLVSDDGRIKVGDFGLARAVTTTTNTGTLIGTVAYLAPELLDGRPGDARSDIYSVGIMAYEMLTGEQPFRGELPVRVAMQHVTSSVPAPSAALPGLAADLDELVRYCTEKDPESRPADGFALLEDLRHIRTTLSDEELDYTRGAAAAGSRTAGDESTTAMTAHVARPTEMLSRGTHPTSVLPIDRRPAADARPYAAGLYPPDETGPLEFTGAGESQREQKRQARAAAAARARAAAIPVQELRRGNPRRRGATLLIVALLLAVLLAVAGWFFGLGPGALATIPNVQNQTVAQAQALLQEQGLTSTSKDVHDESVQQGLVVRSEPRANTQQRKFQPVTLLVSQGPVLYSVPQLVGGTLEEATAALRNAQLAVGTVTEQYDEDKAASVVLSQDPAPDAQARGATPVDLVVSKGPTPIPVPSVVGLSQDEAIQQLSDLGLSPQAAAEKVFDTNVPTGSVVSQDPSNTSLTRGDKVTLTISKGPKLVKVPNYVGKQASKAIRDLQQLGFEVKVNNILGGFFGTVRAQNPVGKEVPEGSTITLTVV
ncbi:Stk1 family PASTA domain-containing Ser/Thr kinase [Paenarthrobacter sp. Z7-10]|uniref:Stk1 family PASTA domain-containing Ser/Thr kinase n=1 Tax=Paenarthrobacter sp. Z7-10 TaxID=2787635 RepID=UPI0022A9C88E|nr:Stk1 family PASTA domain-containing Ser/Thr kinase [Paenarthrobacter sp. Z7-10]MCZ2402345.1 Stk1 family PASTA domain-containing Ser/Thr kinase [Paenarthrobacter sp. Z7-10]